MHPSTLGKVAARKRADARRASLSAIEAAEGPQETTLVVGGDNGKRKVRSINTDRKSKANERKIRRRPSSRSGREPGAIRYGSALASLASPPPGAAAASSSGRRSTSRNSRKGSPTKQRPGSRTRTARKKPSSGMCTVSLRFCLFSSFFFSSIFMLSSFLVDTMTRLVTSRVICPFLPPLIRCILSLSLFPSCNDCASFKLRTSCH